jgi:PKD repeat protein
VSGSTSVTVQVVCTAPVAPTAGFAISGLAPPYQVRIDQTLQFLDTSTGGPTSWAWDFGDGSGLFPAGKSSLQNPAYTFTKTGTFVVTLTATNCKGSSPIQQAIQVLPACSQTAVPVASFRWSPTGTLTGFPEQQQPYAGQPVTLVDASNNSPDQWSWCDFQELGPSCAGTPPGGLTTQTVNVTWSTPGPKNVRLWAHNCIGWSAQQTLEVVTVYPDVRHVVANFSWSPDSPNAGDATTFTAATGDSNGGPDTFVWAFDDAKGTQTGSPVVHTFSCAGTHKVTLISSRSNYPSGAQSITESVSVGGTPCGPSAVMTVDNAKVNGLNGTQWRTDVWIFNPASSASSVTLQFLPINLNNANPFTAGPYPVPSKGTLVESDILGWVGSTLGINFTKTALRVTFANDQNVAPMIVSRTYTPSPGGGTYGQYAPGIGVIPGNPAVSPVWITGLHNNGTLTGYRTNYSLLNLQGDSGVNPIVFTLYDMTGTPLKSVTQGLLPFGYIQDSIRNLFGAGFDTVGTFSLKIEPPAGASVQAYGSVVDNLTGAPVLIPAGPSAPSPVYLPAVAHLNGKNGTVWRSDMQLTNTDSITHTWAIAYVPKASDPVQPIIVPLAIGPHQSVYMTDALNWMYSGLLTTAVATSGVIKIAPADGTSVLPAVQARTFNSTVGGTFGQNIVPLWAELGAAAGSQYTRLLLTGLATADIARSSLGFINLSETSSVIYQVYFYDELGNLLNPRDQSNNPLPYTFSLPPGGWDQDQIENRFFNAFAATLPANLRAISAEVFVTGGGPGSAYATVTDNITGDPTFIPAQAAP